MSTTSKARELNRSPLPADPPPPYREFDGQSRGSPTADLPEMASADYYTSHPQNSQHQQSPYAGGQQATSSPHASYSQPSPQPATSYPAQQSYPQPPPPQTQQYPTSQPYQQNPQYGLPPAPQGPGLHQQPSQSQQPPQQQQQQQQQKSYGQPQQYFPPPPPPQPQQQQQQPLYNSSQGPAGSPYMQNAPQTGSPGPTVPNGWNPIFGPHPHARPYASPPAVKPFGGPQRFPSAPHNPYPTVGAYTPPPGASGIDQNTGPSSHGKLSVPPTSRMPRRYSDPSERQDGRPDPRRAEKWRHDDAGYDSYDSEDERDARDGRRRERRSGERGRDGRDSGGERSGGRKKKDHTNRNTFLGGGAGALIGDLIFPGLGTVGGLILGGYAGHEASKKGKDRDRSRSDRDYRDHRDYRDRRD